MDAFSPRSDLQKDFSDSEHHTFHQHTQTIWIMGDDDDVGDAYVSIYLHPDPSVFKLL